MSTTLSCVCCGRPRAAFTGSDRCSECRHRKCPRCVAKGLGPRKRRPTTTCPCGAVCSWPKPGRAARCLACSIREDYTDAQRGPQPGDPEYLHEYHRRAMLELPLFDPPVRTRGDAL